ncbi:site-2 protease family protein [Calditerrivibrio nitroreducens]|uniref:Peptidase M50 n=1 Tax=Calditerrivibrio nitroreducens (strain DSM 19672 / NBRC 101217 / Yu37-1) TaxID=768670 RepID=E4TF36_CALNY|nr:site-2 protease family protein [Calditerrivibrio nitroreducens]ADR19476.1 peptidase M50 [Calditerrivibrio nitroreducens DSM 19672]
MFDINVILKQISVTLVPFFLAVTIHEVSHGYAAYFLGDRTAKDMGRLTLNPFAHIDIFGLLFLLITQLFGWAKPIPVDFSRLKNRKYGPALVAFAGPFSNFALAIISAILLKMFVNFHVVEYNRFIFEPISYMLFYSVQINIVLGIFNMIPILPLDGGRILQSFLPYRMAYSFAQMERYGFIIILILVITGAIRYIIYPVIDLFMKILL